LILDFYNLSGSDFLRILNRLRKQVRYSVYRLKGVWFAVCGIFLILFSTGIVSGTTNVVKAQSGEGGVNGQGNFVSGVCGIGPLSGEGISFSASGTSGSVNSGEFSIDFASDQILSGSIGAGTFSTTSYQLTGQLLQNGPATLICVTSDGNFVPNIGDAVTISGNCGTNVPIEVSMSNNQIRIMFTGNVQCIVPPPPIPTPPPDSACEGTGNGNTIITGTNGADTLIGTNGNNIMNGLAGNDAMNGCSGNDQMNGGAGNDGMAGSAGNDNMHGNDGDDNVQGGHGNDVIAGDGGVNTLTGGQGSDVFLCGPNGDTTTDFQPGQDTRSGNCIFGPAPGSLATSAADSSATTPSTLISLPTSLGSTSGT
jgi:Ca2+-binding RTX toxin-like protein